MPNSFLDDALITIRTSRDTRTKCALPDVFARLVKDDVTSFEALQAHQQQSWHSFLVQLAAVAIARSGSEHIPETAEDWRDALLMFSGASESAWCLVVDDVTQPAFMQPPVLEGSLEVGRYKADVPTPDQLDVLITSKNHDLKQRRISNPRPEHWLFALVNLQTMEGFLGRGNYGVVRMNGGFGNRPMVGVTKGLGWSDRFNRDLGVLLDARDSLSEGRNPHGHALLWLTPWDGRKESGIPLTECDPYFIEICRRIRFTKAHEQIVCWRANSEGQRIDAPESLNGITGDPWTPVDKSAMKALTVGEGGFTYDLLQQILFSGDYAQPSALEFRREESDGAYVIARTLVRGQGKTDGLHYRIIPMSSNVTGRLFRNPASERERLGERARQRVEKADKVRRKVLYPSVAALLTSGGDGKVDWDQAEPWFAGFERAIDARFFESLWASIDRDDEEASRSWGLILYEEAGRQFEQAERNVPVAAIHTWKARSKARSIFEGSIRRAIPEVFEALSNMTTHEVE